MTDRTMEALKDIIDVTLRANGRREDVNFLNTLLLKAGDVARAALTPSPPAQEGFQDRVQTWMQACFGPEISGDKLERGDRLLEEVLELLQSGDYPRERVTALLDYSYARDKGEPHQETGGVMVTLAAYCLAHDLDMRQAGEDELARVWTKIDKIRAKQAAKPTGSALPVKPVPPQEGGIAEVEGLIERLRKIAKYYRMSLQLSDDAEAMEKAAAALSRLSDALERIALLDEADGHELTVRQAFEAVAIATKTLGKHPSEIFFARRARALSDTE